MKERAHLIRVEHSRRITKETDSRFLFEYQRAVLLSLKEDGTLDEAQYRWAEEKLKKQLWKNGERIYDTSGGLLPGVHRPG